MNLLNMFREVRTVKKLLTDAEREARAMGDSEPGAEHLLLAAVGLPDGSARRLLERHGIDETRLRAAIAEQDQRALEAMGIDAGMAAEMAPPRPLSASRGLYRSAPSAQHAFRAAAALAREEKPSRLSGAHVVQAVAEMEQGTSARVIASLGVDRSQLAAEAAQEVKALRARPRDR